MYIIGHPLRKQPINCVCLLRVCLKHAATTYVGLYEGLSGEIGSLIVDDIYVAEQVDIPIDTLIVGLTKEEKELDEFGAAKEL